MNRQISAGAAFSFGAILVLIFFIQGVLFIRVNSQTVDEATHLAAGYSYLATGEFRLDSEHPPLIKVLQALPLFLIYKLPYGANSQLWQEKGDYLIGRDFLYNSEVSADRMLALSRMINLFLGGLLIVVIGWWAYRLWGRGAALLAISLACVEPNLIAHASLVTTDLGAALFIFLTIYLLWEYLNRPTWRRLAAVGLSTGMGLAAKFSALLLLPMIGLIVGYFFLFGSEPFILPLKAIPNRPSRKLFHAAAVFCLILLLGLLTIPPAYFFQGFKPWLAGFERFQSLADAGRLAFFLGEYSYLGWWSYYLVAFLIKTPIGILMLIGASLVCYRTGSRLGAREAVFLLIPVAVVFLAMTQAKVNIGLRHVLPVYPFLFVLASRLATIKLQRRWLARLLIGAPIIFAAASSMHIAPHQLAYFNEFVGGPAYGYRYLSDSNLDWGQDLKGVKAYMVKENLPMIYLSYFGSAPPSYYGIRYQYVPGTWPLTWPPPADKVPDSLRRKILAVSVYNLQDVSTAYYPLFRWLWQRQPVAKIGYSIFVYDLTNDQVGLMKLEETYVTAGLAAAEPPLGMNVTKILR